MNIAHTKINAAAGEQFCGFANVRRLAFACLIGIAAIAAVPAAHANPDREQRREQRLAEAQQRQQAAPPPRPNEDRGQRQFDARAFEQRAEEQRRNMQMQQEQNANNDAFRRGGRMTPDERRDLRRQINEAGADIYQNKPRR